MKKFEFENYGNKGICEVLQKHYEEWFKKNEYDVSKSLDLEEYVLNKSYKTLHLDEEDIEDNEGLFSDLYYGIIASGEYQNCLEFDDFDM